MKNIITTLFLLSTSIACFAQWNQNGNNYTTGNLGLGISNPSSKLHIESSDRTSSLYISTPDAAMSIGGHSMSLQSKPSFSNVPYIQWLTSSGARQAYLGWRSDVFNLTLENGYNFSINGGNVGIGTSIPQAKFHIESEAGSSPLHISTSDALMSVGSHNLSLQSKPSFSHVPYVQWLTSSGIRQAYLGWRSDVFNLTLENGYNFSINGGNVGIGTSTPGSFKLAVEGKIGAREVNVTNSDPWPDYVFQSSYKLKPLSEIESFVKENKHLPDVPSAAEVEKNGVNLSEMNALLLKKIEELTLYVIDLKKELEKVQQEQKSK